jgi:hypothetical protein
MERELRDGLSSLEDVKDSEDLAHHRFIMIVMYSPLLN